MAIEVYLEAGEKRTFAAALEWPGWCRSGEDEESALQRLYEYGVRYARVVETTQLGFKVPSDIGAFKVVERLKGNTTTDFGAPNLTLDRDTKPIDEGELARWQAILSACWQAFDAAVDRAEGKALRKGPRGGGRELAKIVEHLRDSDMGYLKSLGGTFKANEQDKADAVMVRVRETILTTLAASARGEIPARGPRGGERWTARYFVRRLAWHTLDHTWEIEDRMGEVQRTE